MTSSLVKNSDKSFELVITLPWGDVKKSYEQVVDILVAEIEVEGFRKGKAPRDLALKKLDPGKIYGEVVNMLLPKAYSDAVAEQKLNPIVSPKVQIDKAEEGKDWVFKAIACEKPDVELGDYKDKIKSLTAKGKIWTPGEGGEKDPKNQAEEQSRKISAIVETILSTATVTLPQVLVKQEEDRLMGQLVDDIRAAGMTVEQYLASSGKSLDQAKAQFHTQAESGLKLEFILGQIAQEENVTVTDEEIQAVIAKEKDEKAQQALKSQAYMLASILRREKTLTFLSNL